MVWRKTGLEAILQKKRSAGTEVTGTQRNNYKQADSLKRAWKSRTTTEVGLRLEDSADRIADRSGRL